jgi:hypothetical protein
VAWSCGELLKGKKERSVDMNASPGNDAFAVCFVPAVGASLRLSAPLHIGQPLAAQDEALHLAEVAAAELPAYGFPRGEVRVMRNAAVVRALQTTRPATAHPAPSAMRESQIPTCAAGSQREVARMALEDLRQQVSRARPSQPAPAAWIACLDQAQRVLGNADAQAHHRQDGHACVTVGVLHERVVAVLGEFDECPAAHASLASATSDELVLHL